MTEKKLINIDEKITFISLCKVFEEIIKEKSPKKRSEILGQFILSCKEGFLFPVMRLIIPEVF
jgi:hypothetical protein